QNLFQLVSLWVSGKCVIQQHLRIAANDGKQIIKVVSDAAREPSYGLHFAGLVELLFELAAVCDVLRKSCHTVWLALGIADNKSTIMNPPDEAIGTDNAISLLDGAGSHRCKERPGEISIFRMHGLLQPCPIPIQSRDALAPYPLKSRADIN